MREALYGISDPVIFGHPSANKPVKIKLFFVYLNLFGNCSSDTQKPLECEENQDQPVEAVTTSEVHFSTC